MTVCEGNMLLSDAFEECVPGAKVLKMLPSRALDTEDTDTASEDDDDN